MFIFSHNEDSVGAKDLAKALNARRIKHEGSAFVGGPKKIVINWGSRNLPPEVLKSRVLNSVEALNNNVNKLAFFRNISSITVDAPRIPDWTVDPELAKQWVGEKELVVARKTLTGSSGEGIHFMSYDNPSSFTKAPLYTKYIKKKDEYRVHFVDGKIIDFQRKALRDGQNPDNVNWKIRNLANGFVFVRGEVSLPDDVTLQAQRTINACGLDFGAIDLIYNEKQKQAYVLEINSAPGLQGQTLETYANAFRKSYNE